MGKKTALIIISSLLTGGVIVSLSLYGRNIADTVGLDQSKEGLASLDAATSAELQNDLGTNTSTEDALKIEQSKIEAAQKEWEKLNSTQKLSRDLFAKYLFLKQNGQDELTPEMQSALIDSVIKENLQQITYKTYTTSNLKISLDENVTSIKAYGDALGKILFDNSPQDTPSELVLLAGLIENGPNKSDVDGLKLIAESYSVIVKKYLALSIPKTAQVLHLKLINNLSALSSNIEAFANIEADPIFAAANVNPYNQNFSNLLALLAEIKDYFDQKGVVFDTNGTGYAFTHLGQ